MQTNDLSNKEFKTQFRKTGPNIFSHIAGAKDMDNLFFLLFFITHKTAMSKVYSRNMLKRRLYEQVNILTICCLTITNVIKKYSTQKLHLLHMTKHIICQ